MEEYLIPVKDHPDLARDARTGAIVYINKHKHEHRMKVVEAELKRQQELNELKSDVNDIKMMLRKLLENGTNG